MALYRLLFAGLPALLYVSDHGESLGEKGLYLHGLPHAIAPEEQTRIPMTWWSSRAFDQAARIERGCLAHRAGQSLSHDDLLYSLLGMLGIERTLRAPRLDISQAYRSILHTAVETIPDRQEAES